MPLWTIAKKDLRLLVRDPRALIILLAMPFFFIMVLGISLGEGFGQKPDDRLRVSIVNLDKGLPDERLRAATVVGLLGSPHGPLLATAAIPPPKQPWIKVVLEDLGKTAGIRVEVIDSRDEAERLVQQSRRAAVLVFGPEFSMRVENSSFLKGGINPFHRDGVDLTALDVTLLRDNTQETAAAIMEAAAQGTLLRVVLPWMIGRAFARISDPDFIDKLRGETKDVKIYGLPLSQALGLMDRQRKVDLGKSLQEALKKLYPKYNLTASTWASLTKHDEHTGTGAALARYKEEGGGLLKRGAMRYQLLVPSYLVMFAFFLVLTVGWLFVAERRQGTMKRLCAAPLTRTQILLGKLIPCFALSLFQGCFMFIAGKLVFGMSWGPEPLWLIPVIAATSLAAMGLALFIAALAKTETQVAIYGTLIVLVLAGLSGTMMGDRSLMPEAMQEISRVTPHAWALDAYRQLLRSEGQPNLQMVSEACVILAAFGVGFVALAWWFLKLE
jgi:linearmycin/streptolysin S transport system permease protein